MLKSGTLITAKRFFPTGDVRRFEWADAYVIDVQRSGYVVRFGDGTERFVYPSAIKN